MKHRIVTAAQMKEIERAGNAHGLPYLQMMENAGLAAYTQLRARLPLGGALLIVCGKGNNGGDGLVMARAAYQENSPEFLYFFALSASLVPIFLITALEILNSTLVWFCPKYAQLLLGKPVTIIRNGEILQDELAQLRITASDLAEALRGKDIFSPKDVYWGVIEPNGSITAAPMPQDGGEPPMLPLLIDKAVCKENLAFFGMDTAALDALLRREQTTREAVLLLLYNGKKSILIQKKAAPKGAA